MCLLVSFSTQTETFFSMPSWLKLLMLWLLAAGFGVLQWKIYNNQLQLLDPSSNSPEMPLPKDNRAYIHRLNSSVEPFLSVTYNLSEKAFKWWKVRVHISFKDVQLWCEIICVVFFSFHASTSLTVYVWWTWQRLQHEKRGFVTYKATVDKLFQIFPPRPDLQKPTADSCRTCSVVGNSVNLKQSHYGPLIDSQDVVIR